MVGRAIANIGYVDSGKLSAYGERSSGASVAPSSAIQTTAGHQRFTRAAYSDFGIRHDVWLGSPIWK